jgi:hypothetical protein
MKNKHIVIALIIQLGWVLPQKAQTPADALMMGAREICVAVQYQEDRWNRYWEGTLLRENLNIGTLTRRTATQLAAVGLGARTDLYGMLHYVSTEPSGGQLAGVSGWQDLGLYVKHKLLERPVGGGDIQAFLSAGGSLPVGAYLSDYMPMNLGLGTLELMVRGIVKYEHSRGMYGRLGAAYLHRGTTTAERDYYYTDRGIYSTAMDVPDALQVELSVGSWLWRHTLQAEAGGIHQPSLYGDDIRRQNAPQPTNKADMTGVLVRLRYFPTIIRGGSLSAGYQRVLRGRNIGRSTVISGAITWQFGLGKGRRSSAAGNPSASIFSND